MTHAFRAARIVSLVAGARRASPAATPFRVRFRHPPALPHETSIIAFGASAGIVPATHAMDAEPLNATAKPLHEPVPEGAAEPVYIPLDPRVVTLWRAAGAIGYCVLLLGLFVASVITGVASGRWLLVLVAGLGLAATVGVWIWYFPKRRYAAWGYRMDERVLETRSGVWIRTLTLLPLSRLQHVDLRQGPLERNWGLATLVCHTAGTHESAVEIPGLEAGEAARLRDLLVSRGGDDGV